MNLVVLTNHLVKLKESEKKDKFMGLVREMINIAERESDDYTYYNWCSWHSHQRIDTRTWQ